MFRFTLRAACLSVLAAGPAFAAAPPDFSVVSSLPGPDDTVWPADGRIVLEGDLFDAARLTATVDGAPARLVEGEPIAAGRTFRLDPAPAEGAAVRIAGTPCDPADECVPFDAAWTAGPPETGGMVAAAPTLAFDLYDHGFVPEFACAVGGGATLWIRTDEPSLAASEWMVITVNGERVRDGRVILWEDAFTFKSEDAPSEVCVEAFVENAAGDRGPATRTCTPCRTRTDAWEPEFLPPPAPTWAAASPSACLPGDDVTTIVPVPEDAEPAPSEAGDDAAGGDAPDDQVEESGCQAAPAGGTGAGAFALLALLAARRPRSRRG